MTERESDAVVEMLDTCEDPPVVEVRTALEKTTEGIRLEPTEGTLSGETTEEPESSVYGSCEDAEAAAEERVQGSRGGGEGLPQEMVPSARDGDGDGIVCER